MIYLMNVINIKRIRGDIKKHLVGIYIETGCETIGYLTQKIL